MPEHDTWCSTRLATQCDCSFVADAGATHCSDYSFRAKARRLDAMIQHGWSLRRGEQGLWYAVDGEDGRELARRLTPDAALDAAIDAVAQHG